MKVVVAWQLKFYNSIILTSLILLVCFLYHFEGSFEEEYRELAN